MLILRDRSSPGFYALQAALTTSTVKELPRSTEKLEKFVQEGCCDLFCQHGKPIWLMNYRLAPPQHSLIVNQYFVGDRVMSAIDFNPLIRHIEWIAGGVRAQSVFVFSSSNMATVNTVDAFAKFHYCWLPNVDIEAVPPSSQSGKRKRAEEPKEAVLLMEERESSKKSCVREEETDTSISESCLLEEALEGFTNTEKEVAQSAREVLRKSFARGEGYQQAFAQAESWLACEKESEQEAGLSLIELMLSCPASYPAVMETATQWAQGGKRAVEGSAVFMLRTLVQQKYVPEEMLALAQAGVMDETGGLVFLHIYKALFEQDTGYKEAIESAQTLIRRDDTNLQRTGIAIFEALVEVGKGIEEAQEALTSFITYSGAEWLRDSAQEVLDQISAPSVS